MGLMFGFCFVSIHVIWFNLQKRVPEYQRTELKIYKSWKKWLTGIDDDDPTFMNNPEPRMIPESEMTYMKKRQADS